MDNELRNPRLYFENNNLSPIPGFTATYNNLAGAFQDDMLSDLSIYRNSVHRFFNYELSLNPPVIYFWLDFNKCNYYYAADFSRNFVSRFSHLTPVRYTIHNVGDHSYVRIAVSSEDCFPFHELLVNGLWQTSLECWLKDTAKEYKDQVRYQ